VQYVVHAELYLVHGPLQVLTATTHSFPSKITPLYETKNTFDIESTQLIVRTFRIGLRPLLGGGEAVFFFCKFSNLAPYGDKVRRSHRASAISRSEASIADLACARSATSCSFSAMRA
jgi:hypothetical protein